MKIAHRTIVTGEPEPAGMVLMSENGAFRTFRQDNASILDELGIPSEMVFQISLNGEVLYLDNGKDKRKFNLNNKSAVKAIQTFIK